MKISDPLENMLEALPEERLKAFLFWLSSGQEPLETNSKALQFFLTSLEESDFGMLFQSLNQLELRDLVNVILMNEFGLRLTKKPSFNLLKQQVVNRLHS